MQPHCSASAELGLGLKVGIEQETKHPPSSPSPHQVEVILYLAAIMAAAG